MSLSAEKISAAKGGKRILSDVSFTAPQWAITGLIGPNGAGKSTLLTALLGLTPATGRVTFDGEDLLAMQRRDRARLTAFVEQSATTEERMSVTDVVALGRIPFQSALAAGSTQDDDALIAACLAETRMSAFATRRFDTLSGGEQQRVHIARALAQQPRLMLLDEPTSHLDISAQLQMLAVLRRKADAGTTVLIALHDLNLASRYCDHLVVLDKGSVVAAGPPATIITPALLRSVYGVSARLLSDPASDRPLIVFGEADLSISPHNPD